MIFHEKEKGPKVWVGKKKAAYIHFVDGRYETDDPAEIRALEAAGYVGHDALDDVLANDLPFPDTDDLEEGDLEED